MDNQQVMGVVHHTCAGHEYDAVAGLQQASIFAPARNLFEEFRRAVESLYEHGHDAQKIPIRRSVAIELLTPSEGMKLRCLDFTQAVPPCVRQRRPVWLRCLRQCWPLHW